MTLNPMSAEELAGNIYNTEPENETEFTTEVILENFILFLVSHFCVGTEMRFIAMKSSAPSIFLESEQWHARAV
jgi:hypothetical protein